MPDYKDWEWNGGKIQKVTEDGMRIVVDPTSGRVTSQPPGTPHGTYRDNIRDQVTLDRILRR